MKQKLEWYLEKNFKLSPMQFGFRRGKGTYQPIMHLLTDIQITKGKNLYMPTAFLDITKAYDNVNHEILYNTLIEKDINIDIAKIIFNLIINNNLIIHYNNSQYGPRRAINGLTQGAILSPLLYIIYTSDIFKKLAYECTLLEYADDLVLYVQGKNLDKCIEILQKNLNTYFTPLAEQYKP